jgi:hypothetical protein
MMASRPKGIGGWRRSGGVIGALIVTVALCAEPAEARTCTKEEIGVLIDNGSADLKRTNDRLAPRIDARLKELQKARGWSDQQRDEQVADLMSDATTKLLDREMNALITQLEVLGGDESPLPLCERVVELRQVLLRMQEIAEEKSRHVMARLDSALTGSRTAAAPPTSSASPSVPSPGSAPNTGSITRTGPGAWDTQTRPAPAPTPGPPTRLGPERRDATAPLASAPVPRAELPSAVLPQQETYSVQEIAAAGQGFFGTITSGLTGAFDYAFQKMGRPSGYVLGNEGGGAFLAGVRYGKGELHIKGMPPRTVYWRGPTIGYDVGAAGSKLMVLVYNVRSPAEIYESFVGVDGSAYLVGGVGLTFLTNGRKVMAPIRTGLGLRLGANIGYLKFSENASWNPF